MDVAVLRIGADGLAEEFGHVRAQLVDGRHDHMARVLMIELLDALAQIGFHHRDAARLQIVAHVALVGQHRLAFDERGHAALAHQLVDERVVLFRVRREMHDDAVFLGLIRELREVIREMRQRVFLDARCQIAQRFPLGNAVRLRVALRTQVPETLVVKRHVVGFLQERARSLRVIDANGLRHARAPFRTCAMWMNFASSFMRSAQPC